MPRKSILLKGLSFLIPHFFVDLARAYTGSHTSALGYSIAKRKLGIAHAFLLVLPERQDGRA